MNRFVRRTNATLTPRDSQESVLKNIKLIITTFN